MFLVTEAHYEDLQPGDLFRFDYPHHGDAAFRPTWRKLRPLQAVYAAPPATPVFALPDRRVLNHLRGT